MNLTYFATTPFLFWLGFCLCSIAVACITYNSIAMRSEEAVLLLSRKAKFNLSPLFISPFQIAMKQSLLFLIAMGALIGSVIRSVLPTHPLGILILQLASAIAVLSLVISLKSLWMERRLIGVLRNFLEGYEDYEPKMVERIEEDSSFRMFSRVLPLTLAKVTFVGESEARLISIPPKLVRENVRYIYMLDAFAWKEDTSTKLARKLFSYRNVFIPVKLVDEIPHRLIKY